MITDSPRDPRRRANRFWRHYVIHTIAYPTILLFNRQKKKIKKREHVTHHSRVSRQTTTANYSQRTRCVCLLISRCTAGDHVLWSLLIVSRSRHQPSGKRLVTESGPMSTVNCPPLPAEPNGNEVRGAIATNIFDGENEKDSIKRNQITESLACTRSSLVRFARSNVR